MEIALSILPGIAVAVGLYVLYIAATKGAPAAWSMVSGWWNKGKNDLASAKAGLASLELRVGALEAKVLPHATASAAASSLAPPATGPAPAPAPAPANPAALA